jgi:excisionase family DNA binding protein
VSSCTVTRVVPDAKGPGGQAGTLTFAHSVPTPPSPQSVSSRAGGGEPGRRLLTPAEVATKLGVCRETVYRLIARNELPAVRVGSLLRIAPDQLAACLDTASDRLPRNADD